MEGTSAGLRQRKKERTREAIAAAAIGLFAERGFEATTVADIAAAADISPRTFFAYFPTKEAVVFHDFEELMSGLRDRLSARGEGEDAIDALRAWLISVIDELDPSDPLYECRHRLVAESPALAQYDSAKLRELGDAIADAVAADLGEPPEHIRPRLVANAATALLSTLDDFTDEDSKMDIDDPAMIETLDEALDFLRAGIASFDRR